MANIKSQKKRNRQNDKARLRNKSMRSELKTRMRSVADAVEAGDAEAAQVALHAAHKRIDETVTKGLLHKRTAARHKSRLANQVNKSFG